MRVGPMSDKITRMSSKKRGAQRLPQFMVHLDDEDRKILDHAAELEKLTRSDVLRRALRAYYRKLRQTDQRIAS
jgi:uncharacterized protein (DUF1778 family)